MKQLLQQHYGFLFEEALLNEIFALGTLRKVEAGTTMIRVGDEMQFMPLLLSGSIRIMRESPSGDEMLLYYLEQGDTCAMTLNCCLKERKSEIFAVVEEDCQLIMLPVENMTNWMDQYESWKTFVFDAYRTRFQELLEAFDSIAFMKMDKRLQRYLSDKVKVKGVATLTYTHQEIANELNTSRVVISRLLKQLEHQGILALDRNKITVLQF